MARTDSRTDPQVKLRLSAEMKANLSGEADRHSRSLSAEIIRRLEWTLSEASNYEQNSEEARKGKYGLHLANAREALSLHRHAIDQLQAKVEELEGRIAALE